MQGLTVITFIGSEKISVLKFLPHQTITWLAGWLVSPTLIITYSHFSCQSKITKSWFYQPQQSVPHLRFRGSKLHWNIFFRRFCAEEKHSYNKHMYIYWYNGNMHLKSSIQEQGLKNTCLQAGLSQGTHARSLWRWNAVTVAPLGQCWHDWQHTNIV